MGNVGINISPVPVAIDDHSEFDASNDYLIFCTGLGGSEDWRETQKVRMLLSSTAPDPNSETSMAQAFLNSNALIPDGPPVQYGQGTGEKCYLWCPNGPSRVSFVEVE